MARSIELYTFDELDEQAQQAAIEKYRYDVAEVECEMVNEDFIATSEAITEQMGLKTKNDYTFFDFNWNISNEYSLDEDSYETVVDWLNGIKNNFKYKDSWYFTGVYTDEAVSQYIDDVLSGEEKPKGIRAFFAGLGNALRNQWEREIDHCSDDEVIEDFIIGNDWEFTADGKRVN